MTMPTIPEGTHPLISGIALLALVVVWAYQAHQRGLRERVERAERRADQAEEERDAELAKLKDQVSKLRSELHDLNAKFTNEVTRLQRLLLEEQQQKFRLQGLLASHGIPYDSEQAP
ncbi:hypothetical protein [Sediminivirga luteola]|uniref:Uncharacterized protein n=1 Tax=Sediminivirga luteola TaxID=1774748 RepID=A0A8J2XEV9_9MICO|nr:hypothetical protein [Sediminivirga luteola]GGA10594.1 hypothetical protein GCM10011333_11740 [Sediminivirga luteola]